MTSLIFYKNVAVLDREAHRKLRIKPSPNVAFAADATAVPVVLGEFYDVGRQCPIGFLQTAGEEGLLPVALLGLPNGRNVFLDAQGHWTGTYIPAFIRRYPFVFSANGPDQLTVCIDRDYDGFSELEGEPLFQPDGQPTPLTQGAVSLLSEFQRQFNLTQAFVKRLQEADVLMESNAEVRLEDGRTATFGGLRVVDEKKLAAIPDATLKAWFDGGDLQAIYAHRMSLGNLVEILRRSPAGAKPVLAS